MAGTTRGLRLNDLDAEGEEQRFHLKTGDTLIDLRPAWDIPWDVLIETADNWPAFLALVVIGDQGRELVGHLPAWKMRKVVAAYRRHYGLCETVTDDQRLAALITAYGKAIEADLIAPSSGGLDLATEWRGRRWRRLLNIIDHLPRHSYLHEAMSEDEELAEHLLAQSDSEEHAPTRRWSEYSVLVEVCTAIFDRLGEVPNAIAAANGAKPRKLKPYPRPASAVEKVRERRALNKHRSIVSRMLPAGMDTDVSFRAQEEQEQARDNRHRFHPSRP